LLSLIVPDETTSGISRYCYDYDIERQKMAWAETKTPACRALFAWRMDDDYKVRDLIVLDASHPVAEALGERTHTFGALTNRGEPDEHWLTGGFTPEFVFASLAVEGFGDKLDDALYQFGLIEECGWARFTAENYLLNVAGGTPCRARSGG
jgi:hypothetical protein